MTSKQIIDLVQILAAPLAAIAGVLAGAWMQGRAASRRETNERRERRREERLTAYAEFLSVATHQHNLAVRYRASRTLKSGDASERLYLTHENDAKVGAALARIRLLVDGEVPDAALKVTAAISTVLNDDTPAEEFGDLRADAQTAFIDAAKADLDSDGD